MNPLPSRHELAQVNSLQTPRPTTVHLHHDRASPGSAQELIGKVIKLLHLVNLKLSMVMDALSHVGVSFLTRFSGEGRGVHCQTTVNTKNPALDADPAFQGGGCEALELAFQRGVGALEFDSKTGARA